MGFFNIFKKKGATAQTNSPEIANGNIFTKEELYQLIGNCDNIVNVFANSVALRATGNGRPEKMHQTMLSYKNIFLFFYDEICGYGKADAFLSSDEIGRYELSKALVFSNPSSFRQCLRQLPANWHDVLNVFKVLSLSGESNMVAQYESSVNQLTAAYRKLSTY